MIDVNGLSLDKIEPMPEGGLRIGALVRNTDLAADKRVRRDYGLLSRALVAGASGQLRNKATTAGNLLQRTRCPYFYDTNQPCNKRQPGSGCAAIGGINRQHAIIGVERCLHRDEPQRHGGGDAGAGCHGGNRAPGWHRPASIPIADLHRLPGDTPHIETALAPGELITAVTLPKPVGGRHIYRKVRDRASYAFALVSVGAIVQRDGTGRVAVGGIAHKPWRVEAAETEMQRGAKAVMDRLLAGAKATEAKRIQGGAGATHTRRHPHRCKGLTHEVRYSHHHQSDRPAQDHRASRRAASTVRSRRRVRRPTPTNGTTCLSAPAYGYIVGSAIAKGRITSMEVSRAKAASGVIAVVTADSAGKLGKGKYNTAKLLGGPEIEHYHQAIAVVVAETFEQARSAAELVKVGYEEARGSFDLAAGKDSGRHGPGTRRRQAGVVSLGDFAGAFAAAPVQMDATYTTPDQAHAMMEPHASIAAWDGEKLTLWTSNQMIAWTKGDIAKTLGLPEDHVRLLSPFIGGGFGGKLFLRADARARCARRRGPRPAGQGRIAAAFDIQQYDASAGDDPAHSDRHGS